MYNRTICILGGTGFVGRHLANRLTHHGYKVLILTYRPERHRALTVNPGITLAQANVHDPAILQHYFNDVDAVINLVGILNESGKHDFRRVHVELPEKVVMAALESGVTRLLHMSTLNADAADARCIYLRTKGKGENLVHTAAAEGLVVTSFRPSVIFGIDDSFFNRFANLLRMSPPIFPLACPNSRFTPVYVNDVAEAMCRSLDTATGGERLELCGPDSFSLHELVTYTRDQLGLKCYIAGLGNGLSRIQAWTLGLLPGKPFSMDNYHALQKSSVCTSNALPTLGIKPTPIDAIVPSYLANRNARGSYQNLRRQARRG